MLGKREASSRACWGYTWHGRRLRDLVDRHTTGESSSSALHDSGDALDALVAMAQEDQVQS